MGRIRITDAMNTATSVSQMADAFHPSAYPHPNEDRRAHYDTVLDAIEAALLFGAGRISRGDFLAAVEDATYTDDRYQVDNVATGAQDPSWKTS